MSYAEKEMEKAEQGLGLLEKIDVDPETERVFEGVRNGTLNIADLQQLLDVDQLTGFLNTKGFERRLAKYLEVEIEGVLIAIDVDDFKRFNDNQGHPAGDLLLARAARVLLEQTRTSQPTSVQLEKRHHRDQKRDLIGRAGGDEFLVFLVGASLADAEQASIRIRTNIVRAVRQHFPDYGPDQTMSLGLTPLRSEDTVQTFRQRADQALYLAKTGKGSGKPEESIAIL